jgi:histidinol-phosphate/aromatic aminotransferase/cobyric acid decarboxylase-like protein
VDRDALAARAGNYDLVIVVNPNNPTGTVLPTEWLHALAAQNPQTIFLVDESFAGFAGQPTLLDRLERAPLHNVLIVASLSKSLGAPGLRLGYVYSCDTDLVARIGADLPIWNLSSTAEFLLEIVLKFKPELAASFERTAADRGELQAVLQRIDGVRQVYPSAGNFVLFRLDDSDPARAAALTESLLARHSIYIKDVSARFPEPAPYVRVAVRHPAENLRLVEALSAHLEGRMP